MLDFSDKTLKSCQVLPQHIAFIMDGNGRWARKRGLPRSIGHKRGAGSLQKLIDYLIAVKIRNVTLFAFSSENWNRPKLEVDLLMELMASTLQKNIQKLKANNVKFQMIGDISALPDKLQNILNDAISATAHNTDLTLNLAINYGGRWDIVQSCKKIAALVKESKLDIDAIDENLFQRNISLGDLPEVDLLIRTSGENRISNFLLWQIAYTEIYFSDSMWPEFSVEELNKIISWFLQRERRFGAVSEINTSSP